MSQPEMGHQQFAAEILEASGSAFAGLASSLLLERRPDIAERFGSNALTLWKSTLRQLLLVLQGALIAEAPEIFSRRVRWTREGILSRAMPGADLLAALAALKAILEERLAPPVWQTLVPYFNAGLEVFEEQEIDPQPVGIEARDEHDLLALRYLEKILEGHSSAALALVDQVLDDGVNLEDLYLQVLLAAQRRIGELWHRGEASVAEEHLVTTTTERAMMRAARRFVPQKSNGKRVIVAAVAMETHGLGVRAVADFFEAAGWRVMCLGVDVPADEIAQAVQVFEADLVVLSTTLVAHLKYARQAIEAIRSHADSSVRILVGGPAFDDTPLLWRKFGAHGYVPSLRSVVALGSELVGLEQSDSGS